MVRSRGAVQAWTARGAETAIADLTDADALCNAFDAVDAVFVMTPPYFDVPDPYSANREAIGSLRAAILAEGVPYVVYLSSIGGGTLWVDLVAIPVALADDTTPDAVPWPWTDAVPMLAAWYAYMAFQRQADADMFMGRYRELMHRARSEVTSTMLPENDPGGVGAALASAKTPVGSPPSPAPSAARRGSG